VSAAQGPALTFSRGLYRAACSRAMAPRAPVRAGAEGAQPRTSRKPASARHADGPA